jgi:hypothetical protein
MLANTRFRRSIRDAYLGCVKKGGPCPLDREV